MPKVIGIDPGLADTGVGIVAGEGFDIGAYSYGTNNHGGHLLSEVKSLENDADRDAFLAAIPGINAAGVNTGYASIS